MQTAASPCCRNLRVWCFCLGFLLALWVGQIPLFAQEAASSPLLLGSISGTVRDADENPLSGITVRLYTDTSSSVYRTTTTDPAGDYTFQQLSTGLYRVGFSSDQAPYVPSYYWLGVRYEQAVNIPVNADDVTGIDMELTLGGRITGTIAFARAAELAYGSVTAYPVGSEAPVFSFYLDSGPLTEQTFEFSGIPADRAYQLRASLYLWEPATSSLYSTYMEYYNDELSEALATTFRLSAGQVISDVQMMLGENQSFGEMYGRVTNAEGEGLPDIRVTAQLSTTYGWSTQQGVRSATTGDYALRSMLAGDYALCFAPADDSDYAPRCYPQTSLPEMTTPLSLTAGSVITGIQVQLDRLGEISGAVLLDSHPVSEGPVEGRVTLYRQSATRLHYIDTLYFSQIPANFSFPRLAPGDYRLFAFVQDYSNNTQYGEFYDDAFTVEEATDISLGSGSVISGIELSLGENPAYGLLQGRVTDAVTGLPIVDVSVVANSVAHSGPSYFQRAVSDAAGNYQIGGLLPAPYRLCFYASGHRYQEACLPDTSAITVTVGSTLSDLDAALQPASFISGTIRATNDVLSDEIFLVLWRPLPSFPELWFPDFIYTFVGPAGERSVPYTWFGVPPGPYRLQIQMYESSNYSPFFSLFYPAALSVSEATDIEIREGQGVTGIDITLPDLADASIAGQVTYFGRPQSGIRVEVHPAASDEMLVYVRTNEQGDYQVNGLRPGTYFLRFIDPTGAIPPSYYADPEGFGSLPIRLADGSQATHANFDLGTQSFVRYIINQLFLPLIEHP